MDEEGLHQLKVLTATLMGIKAELGCISQVMVAQLTLTSPDTAAQIAESYGKQMDAVERSM